MVSSQDPILAKIVRMAHLNYTATSNPIHLSIKGTLARVMSGSFGIFAQNLSTIITQINFGCKSCNLERGLAFTPPQGDRYVGTNTDPHVFQNLSIDLVGPVNCLPHPNSRKPAKYYLLAVADKNYGGFEIQLIGDASTRAILVGLLNVQNRFNKIKSVSSDAGSAFINLNPQVISTQNEDIRHLFDGVEFYIAKPSSQWQNYVERSIQIFKKMIRSMFNISKNVSWPTPSLFEAQLLFSYIANLMNEIPYSNDLENNLLSPNSFIKISNVDSEGPPCINSNSSRLTGYRRYYVRTTKLPKK